MGNSKIDSNDREKQDLIPSVSLPFSWFLIKFSAVFLNRKKLIMNVQGTNWGKFKALFHLGCRKQRFIIKRRLKQNWKRGYKRWKFDKSSEARGNRNKMKKQNKTEPKGKIEFTKLVQEVPNKFTIAMGNLVGEVSTTSVGIKTWMWRIYPLRRGVTCPLTKTCVKYPWQISPLSKGFEFPWLKPYAKYPKTWLYTKKFSLKP